MCVCVYLCLPVCLPARFSATPFPTAYESDVRAQLLLQGHACLSATTMLPTMVMDALSKTQ